MPNYNLHSDKVTSVIQNWNVKFDGSPAGLHVEEFLYRIRSLTRDHFNSDFSIICRNLNILLTGKARDWYWRYHKQVQSIQWDSFCDALRCQYRDFRSSFDIREEVRSRRQKVGETFDAFFEALLSIADRLPNPMSDMELIEILARNLRPEIRQDLLYVPIHSISHLRKLVQMRENFLSEEAVRKNLSSRTLNNVSKRYISEVEIPDGETQGNDLGDCVVEALTSNGSLNQCWNCGKIGHHWQDCLEDRTVFCYGCGQKNVYRPNCSHCATKRKVNPKNY